MFLRIPPAKIFCEVTWTKGCHRSLVFLLCPLPLSFSQVCGQSNDLAKDHTLICFPKKELILCPSTFLIYSGVSFLPSVCCRELAPYRQMQSPGGALALQEPGFHFVSKPKISEVLDGLCYSALSLGFVLLLLLFCFVSPWKAL